MSHNLKINGVEYSSVDKLLIPNTDGEDVEFIVPSDVSDSQHFAFGYKTMTANASFEITGLTDRNGDSFTPKGYAFTLLPSVSSAFSGSESTPSLIACVFDSENKRMTRTRTSNAVHQAFANIGYSSYSVSEGGFKQTASSDKKYNCFGAEYFWIAWG